MVLLHGGAPRGAEKIAACWADARKVPQIVFKPDWARHAKAAPFRRNDQLLEALPIGLVVFPGSGVTDNLADKARKLGIPGQPWRPRCSSLVSRRTLTAAIIDSRDFLQARRRAETEVLVPKGAKIAFAGGVECNDHHRIWATLDRVRTKHPDMVLLYGGAPRGAEKIAACWADARKVPQIVFKPDWARHAKAAPFKRNDQLLESLPIGLVVFPGSGVTDNLADKARSSASRCSIFERSAGC